MKRFSLCVFFALSIKCGFAFAQAPAKFVMREEFMTARAIPKDIARSDRIPLNKRYEELNPEQKAWLNSFYENMGPLDEPPFPLDGIGPIVKAVSKAQQKLLVTGPLLLIVDVSSDGLGTSVSAIGSPSPEMTKFAASLLLVKQYKPARCDGVPCAQKYPFYIEFEVR